MYDDPPDSRRVALDILSAVLHHSRPLDEVLAVHRALPRLEPRDRAFARMLVGTVLRRLGQIDTLIGETLDRPLRPGQGRVREALRIGVAQLLFLDVADHAAVSTTVNLMTGKQRQQRGLVNAVLRRLAAGGRDMVAAQDAPRLNTPNWLWESWIAAYGEETTRAIAEAHLAEPPLDITVRADPAHWADRLDAEMLPTGSLRLQRPRGEIGKLPGYADGAWWVQDMAAALPARLFGEVRSRRVVDLCAAPGGKTAQLVAAGAEVVAVDRSEKRLAQLSRNLQRLGLGAATIAADVVEWSPPEPAEFVLLDAPCTATGTLRRHPDIAQLKRPEDVDTLTEVQAAMLAHAVDMLAPGGVLVYAVCSLQAEEGPAQIDRLLESGAPVTRRPIEATEIGGLRQAITRAGDLRTLPCYLAAKGGMDGFYACRLVKQGS
jgi:16S rRNA (cytosine967-C5)-methyltransferase